MTTLHTRYIFLLLLLGSTLFAQEEKIDISFEVLQLKENYRDIAEEKVFELNKKGFACYIITKSEKLFVRCNRTHSLKEMQKSIAHFTKDKIPFVIVHKITKKRRHYKTLNQFYLGYAAYNRKEYKKALHIFQYNYNKTKNFQHAFAYALALIKTHQKQKTLKILQPYRYNKKAKRLYDATLFSLELQKGWRSIKKEPHRALGHFKKACKIEEDKKCYSGQMYSYYNLHNYKKSFDTAQKIFHLKKSDKYALVAMQSLMQLEKYQEAQVWFHLLKNTKGIINPLFFKTLKDIEKAIDTKKYKYAKKKTDHLLKLYPNNIRVLKKEMQLFIILKAYKKALRIAHQILERKKDDIDAQYTIALYNSTNKEYKNCIERFKDFNLTKTYQKNLYNQCNAYYYLTQNDINKTLHYVNKIDNNGTKSSLYLKIGDHYKKENKYEKAIYAYKRAKEYQAEKFTLEMIYLYSLKDFLKEKKLQKELKQAYRKYPNKKEALDKFKNLYHQEKLYSYYKNHHYYQCYKYGENILHQSQDKNIFKMTGWCAYSLKKYNKAKKIFARMNATFQKSTEDVYIYALSCYKNHDYNQARETLNSISTIHSHKYDLPIASLLINLHKKEDAKKILLKLPKSQKRDQMLVKINKNYTNIYFENAISAGVYYHSQSGLAGEDKFQQYMVPIDYNYFNAKKAYHLYFNGDLLSLDDGHDVTNNRNFMPKIGLENKKYKAEIGLTPIGSKIDPTLTWLLSANFLYKKLLFNIKFKQEEVDETMLSFVGKSTTQESSTVQWGRVVKRGFEGTLGYDSIMNFSFNIAYYPKIFGLNVVNNSEIKGTFSTLYHPHVLALSYTELGAIIGYDSYARNSDLFTYGYGGYFSPQQFLIASLYTKFGDIVNNKLYYQSKIAIGFENFRVGDAVQKGYSDAGVVYKAALQLGYHFINNMDFIIGFSLENMNNYNVQKASFAFVYRFNKTKFPTLNTFGLNHRVNEIIK